MAENTEDPDLEQRIERLRGLLKKNYISQLVAIVNVLMAEEVKLDPQVEASVMSQLHDSPRKSKGQMTNADSNRAPTDGDLLKLEEFLRKGAETWVKDNLSKFLRTIAISNRETGTEYTDAPKLFQRLKADITADFDKPRGNHIKVENGL